MPRFCELVQYAFGNMKGHLGLSYWLCVCREGRSYWPVGPVGGAAKYTPMHGRVSCKHMSLLKLPLAPPLRNTDLQARMPLVLPGTFSPTPKSLPQLTPLNPLEFSKDTTHFRKALLTPPPIPDPPTHSLDWVLLLGATEHFFAENYWWLHLLLPPFQPLLQRLSHSRCSTPGYRMAKVLHVKVNVHRDWHRSSFNVPQCPSRMSKSRSTYQGIPEWNKASW